MNSKKTKRTKATGANSFYETQRMDGSPLLHVPEVEPWPERVQGSELLEGIEGVLRRFVVLPKHAPEAVALWVLHTYGFHLREVSAYLGIESPEKRCGKTTLLSVLSELVSRPVVAANISAPALFRAIEEARPTLIIDEADTLLHGNEELRGILNAGYTRKTAYVVRVGSQSKVQSPRSEVRSPKSEIRSSKLKVRGGGMEEMEGRVDGDRRSEGDGVGGWCSRLVRFSCWCPKVMAAMGRLPETLADRCIVIRMQRRTAEEQCERLRNFEGTELRRRCLRFVRDHADEIGSLGPQIPNTLNDRAADIWEPLLALADLAGGKWPELARDAAVELSAALEETSLLGSLLRDLEVLVNLLEGDRIFSRDVVSWLNQRFERLWAQVKGGKGINEMWLAQQLRPYGVRPRTMKIGDGIAKGYMKWELLEVVRRYGANGDKDGA
ncbi:MAG: hypothetical protein C5B50_08715 [Verrucomicrobia bacterium]|nr:MAG: hypothetical protein C5B50_08715 [Verrucomicrobiota bacterium]